MRREPGTRRPLLQELLAGDPWRVMVGCVLLNRTTREQADLVWPSLLDRYPTPEAMAAARPVDLARRLRRLGLHRQRARKLIALSAAWRPGGLKQSSDVEELPGLGRYAADSWAIFVEGRRDVEPEDPELAAYLKEEVGCAGG